MSLGESIVRTDSGEIRAGEPWPEPEISLLDLAAVLARRKRLIAGAILAAMSVTAAIVFVIPPSYTAEAVILPPQPEQPAQSMLLGSIAGLGGLGGLAGMGAASGLWRNPIELYIGVLKSRTIADALIAKFRLQPLYGRRTLTDTRKELTRHTSITTGRDALIRIRVDDHDRVRAAELANAYVDELHRQNSHLALTSASQRRLFFEQQLAGEKNALAGAEVALKNMQEASRLVFPSGQSEVLIRSMAQLRAEIAAREVQLQSVRLYAASDNPQLLMLEREISALREQLQKLDAGKGNGNLDVSARRLPEASLEYVRKLRDLKYHEALFEILAKQYEAARIDEARLAPLIQVVDRAVIPDKKSWPPRALLIVGAGCLAGVAACFFVLIRNRRRGGTALQ